MFGRTVNRSIASNYKYSLDSNIAQVMETMTDEVLALGGDSSFKTEPAGEHAASRLIDYTAGKSELSLTEATVNNALTAFTDATGIPVVVVVDTLDSVFSRTLTTESILVLILAVVLIVVAIVLIVRYFRRRDRGAEE